MLGELEALGRKPTTLDNYQAILRAHLLPRFGEAAVSEVEESEIEAFMTRLSEAGKAARTRAAIFKLLSQIFSFAQATARQRVLAPTRIPLNPPSG
jgi:hypothetical protein